MPLPLEIRRFRVAADAQVPPRCVPLDGTEAMAYVIAGSGTAVASPPGARGGRFGLATESVLWLSACDGVGFKAGQDELDLLVARSHRQRFPRPALPPLRKVFAAAELPHLVSTRDTRDRLDLVTENVPVGAVLIRADRILYHPGDTAAAHYHTDCHHVFCVLAGSGCCTRARYAHRLNAGDSALVGPGEVHWFENDTAEEFSFVEFWAPPPTETIWTVTGDRCTWAPAGQPGEGESMDERLVEHVPPVHLADPVQLRHPLGVRAAQVRDHRLRAVVRGMEPARRAACGSAATRRSPPGRRLPPGTPTCAARSPTTGRASCSPTTRPSSARR